MHARTAKNSHLGERRFLEYPQIAVDEWALAERAARRLLTPQRVVIAAALLVLLIAGVLLLR